MRHFACAAVLALLPSLALAQEKTVPTPPNVKVEGMPPIPQSISTAWPVTPNSGRRN